VLASGLELHLPARFLDVQHQRDGFVVLAAFLISFLFIRTSARLMRSPKVPWWPGSVKTASGLHLHHLVWGIVLLLVTGFLGFALAPSSPWTELLAALFGIGAGLTLDEFALWIHLRDVYWAEEGRSSVDAVVVATVLGALIVFGLAPFDLAHHAASVETLIVLVLLDLLLALVAILMGRRLLALVGLFIPIASLVGAVRLASPGSPWARRRYEPARDKLDRARRRWAKGAARRRRLTEALAGAPDEPAGGEPPEDPASPAGESASGAQQAQQL
jgi:hypothetical protein